ncbi:MAG: 5'/3'-nucleotidase SurE, partial [Pseudomonadales bacterium]
MRALLTNDDGIDSPGLHALARQVEAAGFEVVVVAPSFDASGTGASLGHISREHPIHYEKRQICHCLHRQSHPRLLPIQPVKQRRHLVTFSVFSRSANL